MIDEEPEIVAPAPEPDEEPSHEGPKGDPDNGDEDGEEAE